MQFIIITKDYQKDGLKKRLASREAHIALGDQLKTSGNFLYGVATLDNNNQMNGSVMVMDFASREKLDEWLKKEPYVVNDVWETIEIVPCKVGPTFLK